MQIAGGYGETTIPRANYGFNRAGAATPEEPAGFSETRFPVLVVEAGGEFRGIHRFRLGYREGDARNRTDIAPSTTGGAQGIVGEAPSGATGVAGNLGVSVETEVQSREFYGAYHYIFGGDTPRRGTLEDRFDEELAEWSRIPRGFLYAGVNVDFGTRDHRGVETITRTTAPAISVVQTLDQEVDERRAGAVLGGEWRVPIGVNVRFSASAELSVDYYDFDLTTVRTRAQNIGSPSDQAFEERSEDSVNGVTYGGRLRGELAIDLSGVGRPRSFEIFIAGEVLYRRDRAQIENLFSGDQVLRGETIRIGTDDAEDFSLMVGVRTALEYFRRNPGF